MIEYINSIPFHLAFQKGLSSPCTFSFGSPSKLNQMLRENALDASLISSAEFLDHSYSLLSPLGISAFPKILSVNFYHRYPVKEMKEAKIGVTIESATSVSLLKVLCKHMWNIQPQFERIGTAFDPSKFDGLLLIGDTALRSEKIDGFRTLDLAEYWTKETSFPFVFAVFALSKQAEKKEEMAHLKESFFTALKWAKENPQTLFQHAQTLSKLPLSLLQTYYSLCRYQLNEKDMAGLSLLKN